MRWWWWRLRLVRARAADLLLVLPVQPLPLLSQLILVVQLEVLGPLSLLVLLPGLFLALLRCVYPPQLPLLLSHGLSLNLWAVLLQQLLMLRPLQLVRWPLAGLSFRQHSPPPEKQ